MHQPCTVLLGHPNSYFCDGFVARLREHTACTAAWFATDYPTLMQLAKEKKPKVIITALCKPGSTLAESCGQIKQMEECPAVITLIPDVRQLIIEHCVQEGTDGFLFDTDDAPTVHTALQTVMAGSMYQPPAIVPIIKAMATGNGLTSKLKKPDLNILHLLVLGRNNEEIATELFLSPHTVATYRKNLHHKLGVAAGQLIVFAIKNGLVSLD